jgi:hypothetical protein
MATLANQGVASQMAFGQHGSMHVDATAQECKPPSGMVFVAITSLDDATEFTNLVAEDNTRYLGTTGSNNSHDGGIGDLVTASHTWPKGLSFYGRWTSLNLDAGRIIAYLGPAKSPVSTP